MILSPARLVLVRHGQSTYNASGHLQGQTDTALSDAGRAEATALRPFLAPFEQVVTSDLVRASETAALLGYPDATRDPRWREIDLGGWAGRPIAEFPDEQQGAWRGGPPTVRFCRARVREDGVIVIGVDAHKRTHTAAAVDEVSARELGDVTVDARGGRAIDGCWPSRAGHGAAARVGDRGLPARLRRSGAVPAGAGETVLRVPPNLMASARKGARTRGKSDPIDALAVARAAIREPDLPRAFLAGPEREIALLVNHRANLVDRAHPPQQAAALAAARPRSDDSSRRLRTLSQRRDR